MNGRNKYYNKPRQYIEVSDVVYCERQLFDLYCLLWWICCRTFVQTEGYTHGYTFFKGGWSLFLNVPSRHVQIFLVFLNLVII